MLFDTTDKPSTPHRPDQRTPPMFFCERCESQFNATVAAASGDCPRCKEKEAISVPLRFRLFEPSAIRVAGLSPIRNGEPPARSQAAR